MMKPRRGIATAAVVAVVILVIAVATIGYVVYSSSTSTVSTSTSTSTSSTTTTSVSTSTQADSEHGLKLRVSINASSIYQGGTVMVNLSEFNTLGHDNNVSKGDNWQVPASLSSCPNTNFWPFGIAVYSGHYTSANASQGTPLQLYPVTPCPMLIRLITAYLFQPTSDQAVILPGTNVTAMTVTAKITNSYSSDSAQPAPLQPGGYTLVAADEWGATAFLYFYVSAPPK